MLALYCECIQCRQTVHLQWIKWQIRRCVFYHHDPRRDRYSLSPQGAMPWGQGVRCSLHSRDTKRRLKTQAVLQYPSEAEQRQRTGVWSHPETPCPTPALGKMPSSCRAPVDGVRGAGDADGQCPQGHRHVPPSGSPPRAACWCREKTLEPAGH